MTQRLTMWLLRISAVLTLIGLALMCWSILAPTPLPIIVAMSVGQGVGTSAFLIYLFVIWRDMRKRLKGVPPP